jgi:hypothetical protein
MLFLCHAFNAVIEDGSDFVAIFIELMKGIWLPSFCGPIPRAKVFIPGMKNVLNRLGQPSQKMYREVVVA